jgi:hypothetical protein
VPRQPRSLGLALPLLVLAAACSSGTTTAGSVTTTAPAPTTAPPSTAPAAPASTAPLRPASTAAAPQIAASCTAIGGLPSGATAITTAPVDVNGDGTPDTFRVYKLGTVWHARAEIASVGVNDVIVAGSGPSMTAIGGATVNNDARQEAWIKVGSGAPTDIISFFVFRQCALQRVLLNNSPAAFPIGASLTHADGLQCFGFNVGIEVFTTNSNDGMTYAGSSKVYTINLAGPNPTLVVGATATQSGTNPPGGPAFNALSRFTCDTLGPAIP